MTDIPYTTLGSYRMDDDETVVFSVFHTFVFKTESNAWNTKTATFSGVVCRLIQMCKF